MSLRDMQGGRALVLRLVLAELVAKRGEGPLATGFQPRGQGSRAEAEEARAGRERTRTSEEPA